MYVTQEDLRPVILPFNDSDLSELLPTQRKGYEDLETLAAASHVTLMTGQRGVGKTLILKHFAQAHGGLFVRGGEMLRTWTSASEEMLAETSLPRLMALLEATDLLVVDDIESIGDSERMFSGSLMFTEFINRARYQGKRIVASHAPGAPPYVGGSHNRAQWLGLDMLGMDDLEVFLGRRFGEAKVAQIDFDIAGRHVGVLSGHDLSRLVQLLGPEPLLTTVNLVMLLEQIRGGTNVKVEEVEALDFASLPGTNEIAQALETHVILPLEHPELARELDIRPKRGVLLYGPPGTGKTSIGRALAHRMAGRFFLIDGSVPTEPPPVFFNTIKRIVEQAKHHAPSVIFIDDADVLFQIVHITGFARYLLTLLDGMESESAGQVCIMMTAMNANKVPSPILRSGRVELWLSTKAPDLETRAAILKRWAGEDLPGHESVDYDSLAMSAENCTPADLRRVIGDARTYRAADVLANRQVLDAGAYMRRALDELIGTRARMANHLRDESLRIGSMRQAMRPVSGDEVSAGVLDDAVADVAQVDPVKQSAKYGAGIGGLAETGLCPTKDW